ncbi:MAG TPA: MFS transporter [Burkholderiales bacterium]
MTPRGEIFFGWKVVAAAFVVALFGWGFGFYGPSLYLAEISRRLAWPTSIVSAAITGYYLLGALGIALVGEAFARLGALRVVLGAWCAMALAVAGLTAVTQTWQVFAAFALMSLGWAGMSAAAVNNIIAPWFDAKRGMAVSWALNGATCGGIVVLPLLVLLTETLGWRAGLLAALAFASLILAPTAFAYLRRVPGELPPPAEAEREEAPARLRSDLAFWTITVPVALSLLAQVGFLIHQIAIARTVVDARGAALAVAVTTGIALLSRIGLSFVIDRLDARNAIAWLCILQAAALASFAWSPSAQTLYVASALFGVAVGNLITLPALVVQREFAARRFARIISAVWSSAQVTFAFGPLLLGALRDYTGSYFVPLVACMAAELLAAGVVRVRRPPR